MTQRRSFQQSNDLLLHLPTACFVAIDEEMTGISVTKGRVAPDMTPAQRYTDLKQAPERYSIIQLGVSLFHLAAEGTGVVESDKTTGTSTTGTPASNVQEQESTARDGAVNEAEAPKAKAPGRGYATAPPSGRSNASGYTVRRYNFYMFPAPSTGGPDSSDEREVVLNPSAVNFLHQHNMSFDLWSRQGVPFTTTPKAAMTLESYITKEKELLDRASSPENPPNLQETIRRHVELRRNEDIDFHAHAMAGLREWLDSPLLPVSLAESPAEDGDVNGANVVAAAVVVDGSDEEVGEEEDGVIDTLSGASYLMPPCNSFLRRALYESIEKEYPSLEVETAANQQIKVWRLNEQEKAARHRRLRCETWENLIATKLGMWRIFEGLRRACSGLDINRQGVLFANSYEKIDWENMSENVPEEEEPTRRNVPLIVHNGFMDICFLLTHFHSSKLPDSYQECKDLISDHFPILYDTKVLATECPSWEGSDAMGAHNNHSSNLSNLFQLTVSNVSQTLGGVSLLDEIHVVASVGRNINGLSEDQEHEAAFDAYMTGAIFLGLCKRIQQNATGSVEFLEVISDMDSSVARRLYGRNKIYQMSMYTMDLEEVRVDRDPMSRGMLPEFTYRVSGIDKAVNTRDIVRCLTGTTDESGRTVNFEIVWIDDTTFLVAASSRATSSTDIASVDAPDIEMLKDHGELLLTALRSRFSNQESITVLEDHLTNVARGNDESLFGRKQKRTWLEYILGAFGLTTIKHQAESMNLSNKRQRVA